MLIEMLKQSVERQPNIPAVFSPEGQFTYSQLWNCALRAAGRMKRLGITKGDTLTIELPRTPEYVSVMIAAWIRGAVFAALDVTYPKDRLDYIALNCNAKLRVNSSFLEELEDEAPIDSFEKLDPLDPSLLIYTSGSTGNPKGVLHTHLSIYNSTLRLMKAFSEIGISSGFRHASSAPFSFVAGIQGLLAVLCNGSTYYPVPYSVMRDHEKLADFIEENSIDCAYISPKMLRVFKPRSKKLRFATTGSERVTGIFRDDIRILNCYGSSESAGGVLFFPIDKAYDNTPVGRPTGNEHVYILDDNNNQVDEGELCLTGHFALGYLGLQENTANTFVPNPFRQHDGFDVMLRSNDIVRRLPDGNIIYINRKDWMVKINGQRVEPGEIEAVLRSVPGVQDAAVKDFENTYQQIYLCAFYSIKPGVSVTEDELRSAAKAKLPAYMIPAFFVKLEKLPVNDNGKLNRKALKAPDAAAWQAEYIAPESEAQKLLCEGMAKVLGLERVGLDDDFFMIGGDSIKAVMLAEHCSVLHLSAAEIYEGRTPRSIAKTCEGRAADTVITKHENRFAGIYPLTASECGMYIEQLANPQSTEYNLNLFYTIRGAGREQIEKAVNDTMTNHEAFHSYYGEVEDLPVRILSDKLPTLTWKAAKDIDAARNNAIADEKPFDLRSGVPVRLAAYELPNNEMLLHIAIHHIAFDGGSSQILTDELLQRLSGITPEKLLDLSDIASDEHNDEYKAGFELYREMFKGGVPANEMPVKCTRPQVIPAADEITHLHFDNDMLSAIQRAAKYFRVTDFEFIFAAISMVVAQYCASDDVVLGIPSNMRNARSKNIIGMFVNSAPVRVMPVRTKTVREFLAEVSQIVRAATRTAWLPFSEIVKEFVPVNDTSRNPVFDVSVNYLLTEHEKKSGNVSISLNSELQKMKRDFVFTIYREDSTIDMLLAYSPELYEPALIGRFLQQLDSTIMAMTNFTDEIDIDTALKLPETQLAELEALSMSAKADIPVQLLHKIFENAVSSVPDRVALIADDKSMTFNELNTEANKIAWSLISKGVKKGDSVVLLLPRRSSYFSALFGVLKAGAAFIPCDPEYPAERVRHIINDSGAVFIITAHEHISDYPKERVLSIDDLLLSEKQENPDVNLTGDDLAYMIYTSGSTGVPKGVMLRHRGICNFCMTHPANILYQTVKDNVERMLDVTTVSFDLSLKDTLGILCNAKTVIFASESQMNDPRALTELIKNHDADAINATPSRYMQYLEYKPFREAIKHCKLVMAGGEHFPQTLLNQLQEMAIPNIINTYGPTETTISSNMAFLNKAGHVTVGRPLLNVREYIIDTAGNLAPRGVVGELYIGGPGVALGYRNLPEQTSQRFIEFRGERFYHSGDYAKWNFEGNVQVLGRMDGQVKLRGLRIELGEIEAVLSEQPGVTRAVAAIKLIDGQEHLCAWYTSDKPLNDDELRSALSARLTRYMVPDAFTRLEDIPVNANGKTDLKALPVPELLNQTEDLTPPQDDTQKRIHDIISGILGSSAFGIYSHFYSVGLTSLSMVSLMLKLSEAFNTNITLSDLRSHDTVAELAKHLAVTDNTKSYAVRSEYPLTQTQYGIYIECLNNPDTTIYNIPVLWKLGTGVDINRLKAAVVAALDAHPFIKTRLKNQQGNIIALRNDDMPPEVNFIRTDNDIEPDKLVRPYDLLNDNLYRAEIYATPAGNYFFLDMHHIASDGRSRALIVRDIERVYAGEQIRAEKWTGFDTALLEQEERNGSRYEAAKAWYDSLLSDAVSTELPPVPGSAEGEDVFLKFNTNLEYNAIKSFCDRLRITGNAFFNAVYGYVLAVFAASDEAVFTTIYDGRNDARLMNTVSMLVKTLPVRCKIEPTQTVAEFLTDMRDQLNNSMNSDLYSFAEIARAYGISADYMVAWQDEISIASVFCGEESEIYRPVLSTAKSALSVDINIKDGKIVFVGEHRTEVFGIDFMRSFLECMTQVAAEFMTRKTLGEICPVSQAGEEALKHFHDTGWPVVQRPAYRLLQDSAHRWPNRVAVVSDSVSLTYEQLNARANRLARVLRDKGVGVEKICAVMLERSVDVYTARQAVLKAGGAFLPIDPEYPDDRVRFILQDSECVCMVTNRACYKERSEALKHEGLEICFVDEAENDSIDCSDLNIDVPFDALCYTIYTSGSTGQPKGVMLTQRNLVSFVDNNPKNREILGYVNRGSVSLALASIAFDVSIMEEFIPLANGMTVVMTTEDERHDYIALSKLCLDNKVDIITCTPSMMSNMLNVRQMHPVIKNLKSIDLGAEAFPAALYGEIRALNSDVYIMNGYGPTETTISCTMAVMEGDERITIGIPNSNVKVVMMDTLGHVLPVGALGEMIIIGEGVGRGYINRNDLTARSFITLWDRPAYRSGDLARLLPDGNIEFRGRTDNQVKLRGLRVELDEIENVMLAYPGVRIASVIVRNNGTEDYLAGFFTGSEKISPEALSNFMRTKLTAYMIPDVLMQLDEMPLTSNGKIDKKKLPDIRFERSLNPNKYVAPANDLEKAFCDKFAEILKLDRVGATDSFFEIGGTSLSAMILVAFAVGQGWDLVYRNVFDYTTPRELAEFVRNRSKTPDKAKDFALTAKPETACEVLSSNIVSKLDGISSRPLGNVLLTGATGFLGIHVLKELLKNGTDDIICLVRGKKNISAKRRLLALINYYFDDISDEVVDQRIKVLDGDVTDKDLKQKVTDYGFDSIINCAAVVKHFAQDDLIERVNVGGVNNLVELALERNAMLVQVSTESVAGHSLNDSVPSERVFTESDCDIGQTLGTKYTQSKITAEKAVIDAIENHGLKGKIIRLGNLMGRRKDGEFQINFDTNAFMNRLKAYVTLGCYPVEDLDAPVEFSPIDSVARALTLLSGTQGQYTVFHVDNCHTVHMANILDALRNCGMRIDIVSYSEFAEKLNAMLSDSNHTMEVSSLLSYRTNAGDNFRPVTISNAFTVKALYRLGFSWPIITPEYIEQVIMAVKGLGFFDLKQ